jgi:hypothetical protein
MVGAGVSVGVGLDGGGWWLPVSLVIAAAGVGLAVRGWLLRVEVHPDELVLINWFTTVRLRWHDVARCGHDGDGVWVRRADGRELHASAFQHGHRAMRFARQPALDAAARLEKIRKRRR